MAEPYEIVADYPETGVKTILVRGVRHDVQSLTPIDAQEWDNRLQAAADALAIVMDGEAHA